MVAEGIPCHHNTRRLCGYSPPAFSGSVWLDMEVLLQDYATTPALLPTSTPQHETALDIFPSYPVHASIRLIDVRLSPGTWNSSDACLGKTPKRIARTRPSYRAEALLSLYPNSCTNALLEGECLS